jgi:hypothetical protein
MVCVVHAADSNSQGWNEEQDRENVLSEISRQENIGDAGKDIDKPCEEDEVQNSRRVDAPLKSRALLSVAMLISINFCMV